MSVDEKEYEFEHEFKDEENSLRRLSFFAKHSSPIIYPKKRKSSKAIVPKDKLVKILFKGFINRIFPNLLEEPDPHVEKYSIFQNKYFLEKAKKVFSEKITKNPIIRSKKYFNEDLENLKNKGIEYIKKSKINIEESEIVFELLHNLNPFSENIKRIKNDFDSYEKLLTKLIYVFKYEYYKKNNLIFRFDDSSDKFYLILKGEVDFLVPNEEIIELTIEEYLIYLLRLRNNNEEFLLSQTIQKNIEKFKLSERDFDMWVKRAYSTINDRILRQQEKMKRLEEEKERKALQMRKKNKEDKNEKEEDEEKEKEKEKEKKEVEKMKFGLFKRKFLINVPPLENEDEIELSMKLEHEIKEAFIHIQMSSVLFKKSLLGIKNEVSSNDYIKRILPIHKNYGDRLVKKFEFKIYKYYITRTLNEGNYFGQIHVDSSYNNDGNKRVQTVISSNNCDLCYLSKIDYNDLLLDTFEKGRKELLSFLFNLGVFQNLNLSLFMRNYTQFFEYEKIPYKEVLFKQNTPITNENHYVYFIYKGSFDTISKLSIKDMDILLNKTSLYYKLDKKETEKIKNFKEYYKKYDIKFDTFGEGDIIGLNDCNYKNRYIYNVYCSSTNAKVYRVHYIYLRLMMGMDNVIQENFQDFENIKITIFYKMLLKQREAKVNFLKFKNHDNIILNENNNNNLVKVKISERLNSATVVSSNFKIKNKHIKKSNVNKLMLSNKLKSKPISLKIKKDDSNSNQDSLNSKINSNQVNKTNISSEPSYKQTVYSTYSMYNNNISSKMNNTYQNINNSNNTINSIYTMTSKNTMNSKNTIDSFRIKAIKNPIKSVINSNDNIKKRIFKKDADIFNEKNNSNIQEQNFQNIITYEKEKNKMEKLKNPQFINPLMYDNFDKSFNTLNYFKPKNYDNKSPFVKYYLLLNNGIIEASKSINSNNSDRYSKNRKTRNYSSSIKKYILFSK